MWVLIICLLVPPTTGQLCTEEDPDFTEYRYEERIPYCARNVTVERKIEICKRDGVKDRSDFTVDHIIPLSIGGSNNDENLWCQHYSLAVTDLETKAYRSMLNATQSQQDAIEMILDAKFHKAAADVYRQE